MVDQQVDIKFDKLDLTKIKYTPVGINLVLENFVKDIHEDYDVLKEKYGLTRDQAKRLKNEVYNQYENSLPEGFKEISEDPAHCVNNKGDVIRKRTRRVLTQSLNKKGYLQVCLSNKVTRPTHRLVAKVFCCRPIDLFNQVNHIDGNKTNNNADNLEWTDNTGNIRHAYSNGLIDVKKQSVNAIGEGNNSAKLTDKQVLEIRNKLDLTNRELAEEYGVSVPTISAIRNNRTGKHLI